MLKLDENEKIILNYIIKDKKCKNYIINNDLAGLYLYLLYAFDTIDEFNNLYWDSTADSIIKVLQAAEVVEVISYANKDSFSAFYILDEISYENSIHINYEELGWNYSLEGETFTLLFPSEVDAEKFFNDKYPNDTRYIIQRIANRLIQSPWCKLPSKYGYNSFILVRGF